MTDWTAYQLLASHLYDLYHSLNSRIVDSKGYRPTWKVSEVKDEAGNTIDRIADDLQPLRAFYERIERIARDEFSLQLTRAGNAPTDTTR